jgi:4-diphosphocytidyl-2-C-methyl-D-erythritol kinase
VPGARLTLAKHLPVASGIGGGSADAAAALRGLVQLWNLPIDKAALADLAAGLGADVPACLEGKPALMEGIGERITPLGALQPVPLILVNPRIPLSTPAVYRQFREQGAIASGPRPKPAGPFAGTQDLIAHLAETQNDLEAAALQLCPDIGLILRALKDNGAAFARMSGSGATCFGLFSDDATAAAAARSLGQTQPRWWIAKSAIAQ